MSTEGSAAAEVSKGILKKRRVGKSPAPHPAVAAAAAQHAPVAAARKTISFVPDVNNAPNAAMRNVAASSSRKGGVSKSGHPSATASDPPAKAPKLLADPKAALASTAGTSPSKSVPGPAKVSSPAARVIKSVPKPGNAGSPTGQATNSQVIYRHLKHPKCFKLLHNLCY